MAVYTAPLSQGPTTVFCIICEQAVPASEATTGSLHTDGTQAFACNQHLSTRGTWIVAWALFDHQVSDYAAAVRLTNTEQFV